MKKKIISILLVLLMVIAGVSVGMADNTPEAEPSGVLAFSSVRQQMMENNTNILVMEMSVDMLENMDYDGLLDDLRDGLNTIADYQWAATTTSIPVQIKGAEPYAAFGIPQTYDIPIADSYTTSQLQSQYDSLRKQFDDMKDGITKENNEQTIRQLKSTEQQLIQAGETLFVTYKSLEIQYNALLRQEESLGRTIKELNVRKNYGQVSDLNIAQAESGKAQLKSGISTLKMNMDNLLLQYKLMLGYDLGGDLKLGKVPEVTSEQLGAMDLEKDLAKAQAASTSLESAKRTYDDAEKDYKDAKNDVSYSSKASDKLSWQTAQMNWKSAEFAYKAAQDNFELSFRTLYSDIKNKADLLGSAKAALTAEEQNCAAYRIKFKYGQISENAMISEENTLKEAQDKVSTAAYDLFTAYNNYKYAVEHGILN